jgi:hypothetical protein
VFLVGAAPQQPPAAPAAPEPPRTARSIAPLDLTGYWVSVVTEDWRYRMVTPAVGDYQGVPMTPAARAIADAWDPAKEEASGDLCKSYGAPALLRVPGRLPGLYTIETDPKGERLFRYWRGEAPARDLFELPDWNQRSLPRRRGASGR